MLKHQIKIHYTTGNSFGSEDTSGILELDWNNLDVAKENLKRIKEHYMCYKVDNDYSGKKGYYFSSLTPEEKLIYDTRKDQRWYHETKFFSNSNDSYHYSIVLVTDDGNDFQISPFWIGYFERLNWAEIISDDNDMKISF